MVIVVIEDEIKRMPIDTAGTEISPAVKELDAPIDEDFDKPVIPVNPTSKLMSEEDKFKLTSSLIIAKYNFAVVVVIIIVYIILVLTEKTYDNGFITSIVDLMIIVLLLVLGYMFGNQSKRD